MLWQAEQLVLNSSAPRASSSAFKFEVLRLWGEGTFGPGAREATYAPTEAVSSSVNFVYFDGAWASGRAIGIRPVPIWKSTAAAPTPAKDGP